MSITICGGEDEPVIVFLSHTGYVFCYVRPGGV